MIENKQNAALAEQLEALTLELQEERGTGQLLGDALEALTEAARAVVDARDADEDELQGAIADLQDAIPCDDCLCAPCRCPNL